MSENCELRRGLRRREKNANDEGAGHFEKPAPDARAAPPEAHESLISRDTVAEVLLTGLFFAGHGARRAERLAEIDRAVFESQCRTCHVDEPPGNVF